MPWGEKEYRRAKKLVGDPGVDPGLRERAEQRIAEYEERRTEQLREEVASPQPRDMPDPDAEISQLEALGTMFTEGGLFGWAGELIPKAASAIDPNLRPEFVRDQIESAQERSREQHPLTSMAGELAGATAPAVATSAIAAPLAATPLAGMLSRGVEPARRAVQAGAKAAGRAAAKPVTKSLDALSAIPGAAPLGRGAAAAGRAATGPAARSGARAAAGGALAGAGMSEEGSRGEGAGLGAALAGPLGLVLPAVSRGWGRMADSWRGDAPMTKGSLQRLFKERGMDASHELGRDIEATGLHKGGMAPAGAERYARNAERALEEAGAEIEDIVTATKGPLTPDDLGKRTRSLPKPMNRPTPEQARRMSKGERIDFMREQFAPGGQSRAPSSDPFGLDLSDAEFSRAAGQGVRSQPDPDLGAELFAEPHPEAGVVVDLGPVHDSLRKAQAEMHRIAQQVPEAQAYENQIAKRADLYWETPYSDYETAWKARVLLDSLAHDASGQKSGQQAAMLRRVSGQVQEQLEKAVRKHRPELYDRLKAANKKYSTASTVLPAARSKLASERTRDIGPWWLSPTAWIAAGANRRGASAGSAVARQAERSSRSPMTQGAQLGLMSSWPGEEEE